MSSTVVTLFNRWSFFEEWADYWVALNEDVISPIPEAHPCRAAWSVCQTPVKKRRLHGLRCSRLYHGR